MRGSHESLRVICFKGEMLPNWAQRLDVVAGLVPASARTRGWFSRLTNSFGGDAVRTVQAEATVLHRALRRHRQGIIPQLERTQGDGQAARISAAWEYALETMIQQAALRKTCSRTVEGREDTGDEGFKGGDITVRRV